MLPSPKSLCSLAVGSLASRVLFGKTFLKFLRLLQLWKQIKYVPQLYLCFLVVGLALVIEARYLAATARVEVLWKIILQTHMMIIWRKLMKDEFEMSMTSNKKGWRFKIGVRASYVLIGGDWFSGEADTIASSWLKITREDGSQASMCWNGKVYLEMHTYSRVGPDKLSCRE